MSEVTLPVPEQIPMEKHEMDHYYKHIQRIKVMCYEEFKLWKLRKYRKERAPFFEPPPIYKKRSIYRKPLERSNAFIVSSLEELKNISK